MGILVQEDKGLFHLQSAGMSYILQLVNDYPAHVYWGKKLRSGSNLEGLLNLGGNTGLEFTPAGISPIRHGRFQNTCLSS